MADMKLISQGVTFDVGRIDDGLYEVTSGGCFLGFVERAGRVYVALAGTRYDRAVETGQALSLSAAAAMLKTAPADALPVALRSVA
jgi:hypothetical protein